MTRSTRFVLVCLCLIAALVGAPRLSFARSRGVRARADIAGISSALEIYKMDTGDYPTETQYVAALGIKPEGTDSSLWWDRYLEKGVPKDPWGNDYVYVFPGKTKKFAFFDIYSLGEDGQSATGGNDPDDVNSWDPDSGRYYPDPMQTKVRRVAVPVVVTIIVLRVVLEIFIIRRRRRRKRTLTEESD